MPKPVFAKVVEFEEPLKGLGPLGRTGEFVGDIGAAMGKFNQVISNTVGVMTVVAGLWFIFQFIIGAFSWLTAGGDKTKVQTAQAKITQGIIGLGVIVAAVFLIDVIGSLLGLDILSPTEFVKGIWGGK